MADRGDQARRRVLMLVPDMFFSVRISAAAGALGVTLEPLDHTRPVEHCRKLSPDLVILELGDSGDPIGVARQLKTDTATQAIPIVGFYSHVDRALHDRAVQAGIDQVVPRSTFTGRLEEILTGETPAGS